MDIMSKASRSEPSLCWNMAALLSNVPGQVLAFTLEEKLVKFNLKKFYSGMKLSVG